MVTNIDGRVARARARVECYRGVLADGRVFVTESGDSERRSKLSSKNNINMDHYKTKGRGRQGEGVVHHDYKRLRHRIRSRRRRGLSAKQLLARKISLRPVKQTQSRSVLTTGVEVASTTD